jgi:hypothetical protein
MCDKPSYDFVKNLPPCLQNDLNYTGIKMPCETPGDSSKPPPALSEPAAPPCDPCGSWLERYYLDVPMLQSIIHSLEDQVARLTSQKAKSTTTDKKQRTTGSIFLRMWSRLQRSSIQNWRSSNSLIGMTIICLYDKLISSVYSVDLLCHISMHYCI